MSIMRDMVYFGAAVVSSPVWVTRLAMTGKWRTDWPGRFGRGRRIPPRAESHAPQQTVLIHAVSVGEVNAIRLLVDILAGGADPPRIVISVTTDTGTARAKAIYEPQHTVVRYPLDFTGAVRRFLDHVQPDVVALTELEVWPNFVEQCSRRGIPVCVINGRLSARSYSRYRYIAPLVRQSFAQLAAAGVQSQDYAQRFIGMGVRADRVHVLDTMKWDTAQIEDTVEGADELAEAMGIDRARPLVVAGSTGDGEEGFLLGVVPADVQLLLVPRKPERFDAVAALDPQMIRRSQCLTQPEPAGSSTRFVLDTMGELRKAYALADIAIVGRSFNGWGGSDPIEPIGLGKPTIIGPDYHNFTDTVDALQQGRGIRITTRDQLGGTIHQLLKTKAEARTLAENGRTVIRARQGATRRHAEMIHALLEQVRKD